MKRLRVLVANQRQDRLAEVVDLIANLGHEVIAPQIEVSEVGAVTVSYTHLTLPTTPYV